MQDFNDNPEENEDATSNPAAASDDPFFAPQPKKAVSKYSIMGFGGIVALLGIFGFMHLRGPSTAAAASAAPNAQTNQTISLFLAGGTNNIRDMETSLKNTQKQVRIFENYPSAKQVPLGNLKTNPFAYRSDDHSAADAAHQRAEQQAAIEKAAKELKLQSIMYSSRPHGHSACMINNSLCNIGGQISGFTITKINPNSIELSQGSLQFELQIQK